MLKKLLLCKLLKIHKWTSACEEGIKPDTSEIRQNNALVKFAEYATMYCKCCGKVYEGSIKFTESSKKEQEKLNKKLYNGYIDAGMGEE